MNGIKAVNFAHEVATAIENSIRNELKAEAPIHIEPVK